LNGNEVVWFRAAFGKHEEPVSIATFYKASYGWACRKIAVPTKKMPEPYVPIRPRANPTLKNNQLTIFFYPFWLLRPRFVSLTSET